MRRIVAILVGVVIFATAGCASAPPRAKEIPTPAAAPAHGSRTGNVGFQVVADPSVDNALADRQEFVVPRPVGTLAKPEYPAAALAAGAEGTVGVRITIDPAGRVIRVVDSPVVASTAGAFAAAFRAETERAATGWTFTGGHVDLLEDGKDLDDDGKPDYTRVVQSIPVAVTYDVRFDFSIAEGAPVVRGGVP
jgi:TonB family protein